MLDTRQLHKHILALDDGDDTQTRSVLQCLRDHDPQDWTAIPMEVSHSLVKALQRQLLKPMTPPLPQKEIATILGNMGTLAKAALPELIALLHKGVPDPVREAAIIACGKIGREAKAAVDHLVQLLSNARPSLVAHAIRALGNIGCADGRVRSDRRAVPGPLPHTRRGQGRRGGFRRKVGGR